MRRPGHYVDFSKPDWPEKIREKEAAKKAGVRMRARRTDKTPKREAGRRMWRTYAMRLDDIQQLHKLQGGRCANTGCRARVKPFGRSRAVDHCHKTGRVRGMLCKNCNLALGLVLDNPKVLTGLIAYLERNEFVAREFLDVLTNAQMSKEERHRLQNESMACTIQSLFKKDFQ